jgi:polyphosphate glucokinase
MDVLVVDVGGSHIKIFGRPVGEGRRLKSSRRLTPERLIEKVRCFAADRRYDVVPLGYPGAVGPAGPLAEPGNLGNGWVDFDFAAGFGKPVRIVNDAVMHALGNYDGGRMLFLGLGTGLASALVSDHVVVPLELGNIRYGRVRLSDRIGRKGLEANGIAAWRRVVGDMIPVLREALPADYVVLGGGNARLMASLPPFARRANKNGALSGGLRLWEELVEPHDRKPPPVWRVVR